jgi:hypothetical protein
VCKGSDSVGFANLGDFIRGFDHTGGVHGGFQEGEINSWFYMDARVVSRIGNVSGDWSLVFVEDVDRPFLSGGEEGYIVLELGVESHKVKVCNSFDFFLGRIVAVVDSTSTRVWGWDPDVERILLDVVCDYTIWVVDASKIIKISTLTEIEWHI